MTIVNAGSESDRLISGTLPRAGHVELDEMKMNGNVMQCARSTKAWKSSPATLGGQLRFEKGGLMDIQYRVESVGAHAPHQHTGQTPHQHGH